MKLDRIKPDFYDSLFNEAKATIDCARELELSPQEALQRTTAILEGRTDRGIDQKSAAFLLQVMERSAFLEIRSLVISEAAKLRTKLFKNKVAVMAPVEFSSFCSSTCRFCGWRKENRDMLRLRLTEAGLKTEIEFLVQKGITHIELSGGDDLHFVRNDLQKTIKFMKDTAVAVNSKSRISMCLTPLHEPLYEKLKKDSGLDTVLTWQESYHADSFYKYVKDGPKRYGIDEDIKVTVDGNGHLFRMMSQESAVRAGLQVGIGVMIGLSEYPIADALSVIMHGTRLINHYSNIQPIIIGMPLWNPITTERTDLRPQSVPDANWSDKFEYISAVYLLAFPDRKAWVFPNCRVDRDIQIKSILAAGAFTSSTVRVGPGAYKAGSDLEQFNTVYSASNRNIASVRETGVLIGEQFVHHFDEHESYVKSFNESGLEVVNDFEIEPSLQGD